MSAPERSASAQRADKCIAFGIQTWNEGAKLEALCSDCNGVSAVADLWKSERGYGEWVRTEDALKACETVARRRAIEELKALLPEFCSGCKAGLPPVDHPRKVNKPEWFPGLYHNREEVGMIECECPEIHDRIAAIESEEA